MFVPPFYVYFFIIGIRYCVYFFSIFQYMYIRIFMRKYWFITRCKISSKMRIVKKNKKDIKKEINIVNIPMRM